MPPKPAPSEKKQIRQFSVAMGAFLAAVINTIIWYKNGAPNNVLYLVAGVFAGIGLALPAVMKPFFRLWMKIAHGLGYVNTRLILGLVFYVMFTPIGLLTRLFRIDFLDRRWPAPARPSHWRPRGPAEREMKENLERQF